MLRLLAHLVGVYPAVDAGLLRSVYDMVRVFCTFTDRGYLCRASLRACLVACGVCTGVMRAARELHDVTHGDLADFLHVVNIYPAMDC